MTVIAWDGETLAADRQLSHNGTKFETTKIIKYANHLIGVAGDSAPARAFINWYTLQNSVNPYTLQTSDHAGYPLNLEKNTFTAIVIKPNKLVFMYVSDGVYPIDISDTKFIAIGSGRDSALGALHMGASARRSVEIACLLDDGCGMGIDELTLDTPS